MERTFSIFIAISLCVLMLTGCTSKLVVQSTPAGADIYVTPPRSDQRIKLGTSPLVMDEETFKSKIKSDPYQLEYFHMTLEKEGFQKKEVFIPGLRWGHLETTVVLSLSPAKEGFAAKELLQFLINAQQFAHAQDFYNAHAEVNKALAIDSKFARAHAMRGAIFYVEKNYSESLKAYQQSLSLDSQQLDVVKMVSFLRKKNQSASPEAP